MSMILINSSWQGGKTFKMIPSSADCPYVECIYDPNLKVLAIVGNIKKDVFHMVAKLNDDGDEIMRKSPGRKGVPYKQERKLLETYQEYYLEERSDIEYFVKAVADNADSFDYQMYLDMVPQDPDMPLTVSE
jgi:hypothetical protein